jgi:hypothetical protein
MAARRWLALATLVHHACGAVPDVPRTVPSDIVHLHEADFVLGLHDNGPAPADLTWLVLL